eukprot:5641632-Prymnesium_polylepis.4
MTRLEKIWKSARDSRPSCATKPLSVLDRVAWASNQLRRAASRSSEKPSSVLLRTAFCERHAATANAKRFARTSHADHRGGTGNILLRDPVKWAPRSFFIPAGISDQGGGHAVHHESPLLA